MSDASMQQRDARGRLLPGGRSINPAGRGAGRRRTLNRVQSLIDGWRRAGCVADQAVLERAAELVVLSETHRRRALAAGGAVDVTELARLDAMAARAVRALNLPGAARLHRAAAPEAPSSLADYLATSEPPSDGPSPTASASPARAVLGEPQFTVRSPGKVGA